MFLINKIKAIYFKIKASKARYKRVGKCKACGRCCRSIRLVLDGENIRTEQDFEIGKKCNRYFRMFYISGERENGTLKFTCKHLGDDNKCKRYFFRPLKCWTWPDHGWEYIKNGGQTKAGCGFRYEPSVKFGEVLEGME